MRGVVVRAEHPSRRENFNGRLFRFHDADLPRGSLRAKEQLVREIEGILHIAGGVILGGIERGEIIVIRFDFGTFKDFEAHARKNVDELIFHERDRDAERPPRIFGRAS